MKFNYIVPNSIAPTIAPDTNDFNGFFFFSSSKIICFLPVLSLFTNYA